MARFNLAGKVVLITGAGGGIGSEVARSLYDRGATLVLTDLSQASLDALSTSMDPARVMARVLDVTDIAATRAVADEAVATFGHLDVAFANAAITAGGLIPVTAMKDSHFEKIIEVDLLGVWRTAKACLPHIVEARGQVLLTASIYAFANGMGNTPYAVSKAGVEMLGRSLRAELAGTGASAGVLYPGWILTPMTKLAFEGTGLGSRMIRRAFPGPLGKPIATKRVADAVVAGLERRAPRIIVPRRWLPISLLRGGFNLITDWRFDRDRTFHDIMRQAERQADETQGETP